MAAGVGRSLEQRASATGTTRGSLTTITVAPCPCRQAAQQRGTARPTEGTDGRAKGYSYARSQYEDPVRESLTRLSVTRSLLAEVKAAVSPQAAHESPDQLALARITRQRREAAERATRDRNDARLEAEMDRLDGEEATARSASHAAISAREVEAYLANLPGLFNAAEPATQKHILQGLLEKVEVAWALPTLASSERRG